jgi:Na+-transporting NADH:ubiquinone oxidoreductase subunit C
MSDTATGNAGEKKRFDRDSIRNTLVVAIGLSLVCSVLVASTAVLLKPRQERNEELFRQRIVLEVASLMEPGADVSEIFSTIESRMIDLETGEYVDTVDPATFDAGAAAGDPELGVAIPANLDIANIKRRARYAPVFLVRDESGIAQIILPVYGSGLWATMYGYLALENDGVTIAGLRFYDHGETPGLGDQIDRPDWRRLWVGKKVRDQGGEPRIEVIRGRVQGDGSSDDSRFQIDEMSGATLTQGDGSSDDSRFQVDGISGATLTGRGVTNLVRYWTGPHGFGPYLQQFPLSDDAS